MSEQAPKCKYVSNFKDGGKTIECSKLDILIGTMEYNNAHSDDVTTHTNPVLNQVFQTARSFLYPNTGMAHCAAANVKPVYYSGGPSLASQSNLSTSAYSNLSSFVPKTNVSLEPSEFGGVKLSSNIKFVDRPSFDKVDIQSGHLVYRGVTYLLQFPDNLPTIMNVIFNESYYTDIGVTLEPDIENESLIKCFKPAILSKTTVGRQMLRADEILKMYLCKHFEKWLKVHPEDANKGWMCK